MIDLLDTIAAQKSYKMFMTLMQTEHENLPEGWCKLKCEKCGKVYSIIRLEKTDDFLISGGVTRYGICMRDSGIQL